jgi:hypothetical protein
MNRKLLLAAAVAATFTAFSLPSYAEEQYVNVNPPARRAETYQARAGHVWAPGSWQYRDGKHEWVPGRHIPEQKGYKYEADRWVKHDNEKWTYQRGGWSQ